MYNFLININKYTTTNTTYYIYIIKHFIICKNYFLTKILLNYIILIILPENPLPKNRNIYERIKVTRS